MADLPVRLRRKVLGPVFLALALLLSKASESIAFQVRTRIGEQLRENSRTMETIFRALAINDRLVAAFRAEDRDALMALARPTQQALQVIYLPLHGLNQETLGELIVLRDITDSVAAGRAALTLVKGAVKTVCMNRAAALASDLESLGKSGNLAGAESLCAQLEKESAPLLPSIRSARADESVTE